MRDECHSESPSERKHRSRRRTESRRHVGSKHSSHVPRKSSRVTRKKSSRRLKQSADSEVYSEGETISALIPAAYRRRRSRGRHGSVHSSRSGSRNYFSDVSEDSATSLHGSSSNSSCLGYEQHSDESTANYIFDRITTKEKRNRRHRYPVKGKSTTINNHYRNIRQRADKQNSQHDSVHGERLNADLQRYDSRSFDELRQRSSNDFANRRNRFATPTPVDSSAYAGESEAARTARQLISAFEEYRVHNTPMNYSADHLTDATPGMNFADSQPPSSYDIIPSNYANSLQAPAMRACNIQPTAVINHSMPSMPKHATTNYPTNSLMVNQPNSYHGTTSYHQRLTSNQIECPSAILSESGHPANSGYPQMIKHPQSSVNNIPQHNSLQYIQVDNNKSAHFISQNLSGHNYQNTRASGTSTNNTKSSQQLMNGSGHYRDMMRAEEKIPLILAEISNIQYKQSSNNSVNKNIVPTSDAYYITCDESYVSRDRKPVVVS